MMHRQVGGWIAACLALGWGSLPAFGAESPAPSPPPARPRPARLLMIGDSHTVGAFGHAAERELKALLPETQIKVYAACSATPAFYFARMPSHGGFYQDPPGWAAGPAEIHGHEAVTPTLSSLIAKSGAQVVVVNLGANLLRGSLEPAGGQIRQMIDAIKGVGARCIWVGAPDERFVAYGVQRDLYDILSHEAEVSDCTLIDSRKFTHYPEKGGDSIHYDGIVVQGADGKKVYAGLEMAKQWGKAVAGEILKAL